MQALGGLGQFDDVQAIIKSKVGDFLQAESKILALQSNASPSIATKAIALETEHKQIEADLGTAQGNITKFSSGAWTFSDGFQVSNTAYELVSHLQKVQDLQNEASGVQSVSTIGLVSTMPWVVVGLGILGMLWFTK